MSKETMKLALEFVEYHSKYWNGEGQHPQEIATALREALAEQSAQREPLLREIAALSANALDDYKTIQKLMAERQPLTDEEISSLWDGHTVPVFGKTGINPIVFARAIEAAHGIKENT